MVRQLAKVAARQLIELNFEKKKSYFELFETNDPKVIMRNISSALQISPDLESSILFLDEIQVVPELLAKLRWFAEEMPELAVIATGSLLDFALQNATFSMPVGRISYFYLEPFSFDEFLVAIGRDKLYEYICDYSIGTEIPSVIHEQLMTFFKEYLLIGGLPAAVSSWKNQQSLTDLNQLHNELLSTYKDDFNKYRGRVPVERLDEVVASIPKQLSQKFVYRKANPDVPSSQLKPAMKLLNKARISHQVISTHANDVPLAAETNERFFKEIFLDVGLCSAQLGLTLNKVQAVAEINLINKGGIAEQAAGQILRTVFPFYIDPALYCWMREDVGASSEVDYILQHNHRVIPLEVKAGTTGTLKSLHYFMGKKKFTLAVRVNSDYPSTVDVNMKDTTGKPVQYKLLSIPFYLLGQIHRLIDVHG